jgi:hypothetical protein
MSWSIQFIGKPENVSKALEDYSTKLDGMSKEEYDKALPHLKGLVEQNSNKSTGILVRVEANGHAFSQDGELQYSNCKAVVEPVYGTVV